MRVPTLRLISAAILFLAGTTLFTGSPIWDIWPAGNVVNKAAAPTFSPTGFSSACHGAQTITISTTTSGAQIRYNKGSAPADPTCSSGTLISGTSGTTSATSHADTIIKAVSFTTCGGSPDTSDVSDDEWDFTCGS